MLMVHNRELVWRHKVRREKNRWNNTFNIYESQIQQNEENKENGGERERERERVRERALCCYSYGIYTLELLLQMVLTFNCCSWF